MLPRVHSTAASGPVVSEPPPSPRPRTPGPFSGVSTSHSSMPSTAATQIVSRAGSSPPPLMIEPNITGPFLLYGPSGRLLDRYKPTDLWGLLVSEHTTLNCTYAQTTVRIGRAGCCDTTLADPRVSSTHFTIALELEPFSGDAGPDAAHHHQHHHYGSGDPPLLSSGDWEDCAEGKREEEGALTLACERETQMGRAGPSSQRRRGRARNASHNAAYAEDERTQTSTPSGSRSSIPLPGWRVRRVVLNDCSANGTYVNDVLVGRGEYCELHYGDDISIVRVTEKKRQRRDSNTPTAQSSDEDDNESEGNGERPKWDGAGNENEGGARWTDSNGGGSSKQRRDARRTTAPTTSSDAPRAAPQRKGRRSAGAAPEPDAQQACASNGGNDGDRRVTQLLSALLSTLSTEHTYVERFCFHLYHAEEVGRGGMPVIEPESVAVTASAAAAGGPVSIMKGAFIEPPLPSSHDLQSSNSDSRAATCDGGSLRGLQRDSSDSTPPIPRRLLPTPLQLRGDTDSDDFGKTSTAVTVREPQQQQSHQKSVRFPEYPVTAYDSPPRSGDDEGGNPDATDSPPIAPAPGCPRYRRGSGASASSAAALPPLAPVTADHPLSNALTPAHDARSRASSTGSTRALSAVVTPHSLLRPRHSFRESFIAPIALPEREGSTASSSGSHHSAATAAVSSAALRFHESIGVGPALQRKVAALATRRASSTASTSSNQTTATTGSVGTISAIMRDAPADMPIRYAVLPLRHLQWGGRIGFGASGEVFMGIDVATATVVAIKVLKGGPLFQPGPTPSNEEIMPSSAASRAAAGRPPLDEENTILALTNVSLGPCDYTAPTSADPHGASAPRTFSGVSVSSASPTTEPTSGSAKRQRGNQPRTSFANEESLEVSADSQSSASFTSTTAAESRTSTAVVETVRTVARGSVPVAEQAAEEAGPPPRRDEHPPSPLLRKHFREIIFLTTLQHPRIVRFLGFQFSEDGRLCLLMEYVAGGTLQTLVKNFGAFEENVIRLYTLQILEGLEYLARKGVVHGDLKSANILVSEQGSAKLTDFGTSRFLSACESGERRGGRVRHSSEDTQTEEVVAATGPRGQPASQQRGSHSRQQHRDPRRVAENEEAPEWDGAGQGGHARDALRGGGQQNDSYSSASSVDGDDGGGEDDEEEGEEDGGVDVDVDVDEDDSDWEETEDEADAAHNRVLCGTPLYMSPELIRTQEPSLASDMWALGCVVFEMATGGVLPWRKVHNMSAPSVIWYIGHRQGPHDGPSLNDVFAARAKMNSDKDADCDEADDDDGGGEEVGSSNVSVYEDRSQRSSSASYASTGVRVGRWGRTPSPLLLDMLQATLHMNAAMRPTPAELLQHPFIRNEATDEALEQWHTMVAANRRDVLPVLAPRERSEPGGDGEAEDAAQVREDSGSHGRATLRSVRGSKTDSPFETAVVLANSSSPSRDGSLRHRTSVSPARTTPPSLPHPQHQHHHSHELLSIGAEEVADSDAVARDSGAASRKTAGEVTGVVTADTPELSHNHQPHHVPSSSTPSTGPRRSNGARSSGGGGHLIGDSWEDVEFFTLSPLPHVSSQTRGGTHSALPVATSQSPSVLGAGNPDSQPLIAEPPRRPPATTVRHRMGLLPPVTAPAAAFTATAVPAPLPVPQQPVMYAGPQWWVSQSLSAPPKNPLPRSQSVAPPPSQRPVAYSMPTTSASMPPGMSTSYMRQHQLFLKQNEQERRRLSLSAPHGMRQTRGRHRTEGAAPLDPALGAAPLPGVTPAAPVFPPSYQYAMQQPVFDYTPGYSDYNPQVNTQTVEMRMPQGFASQSFSMSQNPYAGPLTQSSYRKGQRYGSGVSGSQGVSGVHLQRVPASQAASSQTSRASQRKKGQTSSRQERGRAAATAGTACSPPLQPQSPGGGVGSARGPVLSSMSLPFPAPLPTSVHPSMQSSRPALSGLTMEVGNLTLSSPQSVQAFAQMPSFPSSASGGSPPLSGTGYTGAPCVASRPVLLPPPTVLRHPRGARSRPPVSSATTAAAATAGGAPPSPPLAAMTDSSGNPSGVLDDASWRQRQRRQVLASAAVLGRHKHRLRRSRAVAQLQQQRQQQHQQQLQPRQSQRQQRSAARRLEARVEQRAGGGGGGGKVEHAPPLSPQALTKERAQDGDTRTAAPQESRRASTAPSSGQKQRLRTSTRVTSRAATRQKLQRRHQQHQQQKQQRSASPETSPKQKGGNG